MKGFNVKNWKWFGKAAHFICSDRCLFHMATDVGDYMISSVGAYYPNMNRHGEGLGEMETIGCDRKYETYVFEKNDGNGCECGCDLPAFSLSEIDSLSANDDKTAQANHMKLCLKYSKKSKK